MKDRNERKQWYMYVYSRGLR